LIWAFTKEQNLTSACRQYCREAIQLSEKLLQLSYDGNADCDDDRCLVLFGIILDAASKIHLESEKRLKNLEAETAKYGSKLKRANARKFKPSMVDRV
jgi:hypothetical protein